MTSESPHQPRDVLPEGVASRTVDENGVIHYRDANVKHHNPDGPALICPDRATYWLITCRDPNFKPAWWFGYQVWLRHGRRHRTDGPAAIHGNGTVAFYVNGTVLTEMEFYQRYPEAQQNLATDDQP